MNYFRGIVLLIGFMLVMGGLQLSSKSTALAMNGAHDRPNLPATFARSTSTAAKNVEFVGQIGGRTRAVAVNGNYAYVGEGPRLTILNISNPAAPVVVGKSPVLPEIVIEVAVAGNYAYVADGGSGLRIINVANPAAPTEIGFYDTPGSAQGVAVAGNYAYVADKWGGLRIINVANPAAPTEVGFYNMPGYPFDVAVTGHYAYVVTGSGDLRVINVANPAAPTEVGFFHTSGTVTDVAVAVAGQYAYVVYEEGVGGGGLRIINVANPAAPTEAGFYDTWSGAYDVVVAGQYAYIPREVNGLLIINVANPAAPTEAGAYELLGRSWAVAVAGDYAYVADDSYGLGVINVANPAAPTVVGSYDTWGYADGVTVAGGHAYVAAESSGLRIINVANPAAPNEVGAYFERWNSIYSDVAVVGNYAYGRYGDSLWIINVANPAAPTKAGSYFTPTYDVAVAGHYAYVAAGADGLRIINVANPAAPTEVSSYDTPDWATDVVVAGHYAYVTYNDEASRLHALQIIDVANPAAPTEVSSYDTPDWATDVVVAGHYAYVTFSDYSTPGQGQNGLQIIDVANPAAPTGVGLYNLPESVRAVAVDRQYAYVAGGVSGLRVVNVANPAAPTEVGFYDTPGWAVDVAVAGDYAYVAGGVSGLYILRFIEGPASNGFRRERDGFQFENYSGFQDSDFGDEALRELFGDNVVCAVQRPNHCIISPAARLWREFTAKPNLQGGKCDGLASTSLLLFQKLGRPNRNEPIDFEPGASITFDVDQSFIRDYIAINFLKQSLYPVAQIKDQNRIKPPSVIVHDLMAAMEAGSNPPTLFIRNKAGAGRLGHTVVPLSVENRGQGIYWIYVYDNNHPYPRPGDRYVEINTIAETWRYDHQNSIGVWSGDDLTGTMGLVPISAYVPQPRCPWCDSAAQTAGAEDNAPVSINVAGQGRLLISNEESQQIGFAGEAFVNEIPGAIPSWVDDGSGIAREPIYQLPAGDYQIEVNGQGIDSPGVTSVARFDGQYSVVVDNITVSETTQEDLVFSEDGTIRYVAGENQELNIRLAEKAAGSDYLVEILETDLSGSNEVVVRLDGATGQLRVSHAEAGASVYGLQITRIGGDREALFTHEQIAVGAGDTQIIDLTSWEDAQITLCTDRGSDGVMDGCEALRNESGVPSNAAHFLPFVIR